MKNYDYIIAGAGCAGLSLLDQMSKSSLSQKKILLLDHKKEISNDRTWCYWSKSSPYYPEVKYKSWDKMRFTLGNVSKVSDIFPWKYYCLRGIDFYQHGEKVITSLPNVDRFNCHIKNIRQKASNGVEVLTTAGNFEASFVFNSILKDPGSKNNQTIYFKQHFYGLFIESDEAVFDSEEMTLMNFQPDIYDGAGFFYILPFSAKKALIEFTIFSENVWETKAYLPYLNKFIKEYLKLINYKIVETEKGVIPMTDYIFPKKMGSNQMQIGTAGGMTKPTTGYTFSNIQQESRNIVKHLVQYHHPFYAHQKPGRFRFYDQILLNIIQKNPKLIPGIFGSLFFKNDYKRILKFLQEKSHPLDEARIFTGLPWNVFLKSLVDLHLPKQKVYDWSATE